jgi:hypothetical protein
MCFTSICHRHSRHVSRLQSVFVCFVLFNAELITEERGPVSDLCGAIDVVRSMARTVGVIVSYAANATTSEFRP